MILVQLTVESKDIHFYRDTELSNDYKIFFSNIDRPSFLSSLLQ